MRRVRTITALMLVVGALTVVPASAGGGGGSVCMGFGEGDTIVMRDSCFEGTGHIAPLGDVQVVNDGGVPHTLTAVDGAFDTGVIEAGETATLRFEEPGTYRVYCTLHGTVDGAGMTGLISVRAPAVAASADGAAGIDGTGLWGALGWGAFLLTFAAVGWTRRRRTSSQPETSHTAD